MPAPVPAPSPPPVPPRMQALLVGGGVLTLLLLLWALDERLGPFWIAVAGAALVWPVRQTRAGQAVLWAGGFAFAAYVAGRLGGVLAPFVAVFVAAYVLKPVVAWGARRGVPRAVGALAVTALVTGGVAAAAVWLVPLLLAQVEDLAAAAVTVAMAAPTWIEGSEVLRQLEGAGVLQREDVAAEIATLVPAQIDAVLASVPALLSGLLRQVGALLGLVTTAALVPVLLFFCLKDYDELRDALVALAPRVDGRREYLRRAAAVFGSYVRGVLTISALSALLVAVPLFLLGVPYSLLLGLAAGLLNLIPSLGSILTYVLGVGLMLAFGTWADVGIVLVVLAVQAVIEQAVLTPNIMSQQVGLHPVVILLALFASGALFGLVGFVLAVPAAALVAGVVRARREAFVVDFGDDVGPLIPPVEGDGPA